MELLLRSILSPNLASEAIALLERCHHIPDRQPIGGLARHERFFFKVLSYEGFDLTVPYFLCEGDSVSAADLQFKRSSRFRWPWLDPKRALLRELRTHLQFQFPDLPAVVDKDPSNPRESSSSGMVGQATRYHYYADRDKRLHAIRQGLGTWHEAPFDAECILHDEPYSSGQGDPGITAIRNDFVILSFRREAVWDAEQGLRVTGCGVRNVGE